MLQWLLWSVMVVGAPTDAHVTFTTRAAPLEKAVAEIARQSGANLAVDPPIARELVILRLKDAPLADVKKRLAQTVDAEWTTQGPKEVLTRTPEIVKRRKQEAFAERVATWQRIIDGLSFDDQWERRYSDAINGFAQPPRDAQSPAEVQASWRKQAALQTQTPQGRLLARALRRIGTERLAQVGNGQRVVYSTRPTRMQLMLADPGNRLYDTYVAEARPWGQAIQRWADEGRLDVAYYSPFFREAFGPGGFVHLVLKNRSGDVIAEPRVYSAEGAGAPRLSFSSYFSESAEAKPIAGFDKTIVDSEETLAMKRLFRPRAGDSPAEVPPLAVEILTHPESHDVMAGGPSDAVIQAAEHKDLNAIATLPDVAQVLSMRDLVGRAVTLGTVLTRYQGLAVVDLDEKAGWLTLRSRPGDRSDGFVFPRQALAKLIKRSRGPGAITLGALADYATAPSCMDALQYGLTFAERALGKPTCRVSDAGWRALRLYATLSGQQRAAAAKGGATLAIAQMTKEQRALAADIVYAEDQAFSQEPSYALALDGGVRITISTDSEPTSALPNGLPPDGSIRFIVGNVPTLFSIVDSPHFYPSLTSPETIALNAFFLERGDFPPEEAQRLPSRFAMGSVDNLTVVLKLPPAGYLTVGAALERIGRDAKWTGVEGLPKAMRDKIAAELDTLRKNNAHSPGPAENRPPVRP